MQCKKENICIACSIFKDELEQLQKEENVDIPVFYLTSMLHMKPDELEKRLIKEKEKFTSENKNVILIYGDCSPFMDEIVKKPDAVRTEGINCIEILLGKEKYRKLIKEGVFFLMPEWTLRWKEIFKFELKIDGDIAKEFMREFHSKIIYLDTEQIEIPYEHIKEIEEYTGLNVEFMKADLKELNIAIQTAIHKLDQ